MYCVVIFRFVADKNLSCPPPPSGAEPVAPYGQSGTWDEKDLRQARVELLLAYCSKYFAFPISLLKLPELSLRADFTIRCEGFRIGSPSQRIVKSARRLPELSSSKNAPAALK